MRYLDWMCPVAESLLLWKGPLRNAVMGLKYVIVILALAGLAYLFLNGFEFTFSFELGESHSSKVWTNANFSTAAIDPNSHKGEHAELDILTFNIIEMNGRSDIMAAEGYLGTYDQLKANPYDATRRLVVGVKAEDLDELPNKPSCIHVSGTIKGAIDVETLSGKIIYVPYIEADSITHIQCSRLSP